MRASYYLVYEVYYLILENSTNAHTSAHIFEKNELYSR